MLVLELEDFLAEPASDSGSGFVVEDLHPRRLPHSVPSTEKEFGRPVTEWKDLIRSSPQTEHMEMVCWLKSEHGLGHGTPALSSPTP